MIGTAVLPGFGFRGNTLGVAAVLVLNPSIPAAWEPYPNRCEQPQNSVQPPRP